MSAHADRMKRLHELAQSLPLSDPDQPAKADLVRGQRQMAERRLNQAGSATGGGTTRDPVLPNPGPATGPEFVRPVAETTGQGMMPRTLALLAKLEEPVSMSFAKEAPLEDVLKYIKSATQGPDDTGIPIYVDPVGLAEIQKKLTSPVSLDLEKVPLRMTLRLLLRQLGLAYCIDDGVLIISTPQAIFQDFQHAEFNPAIDPGGFDRGMGQGSGMRPGGGMM